MCLRSPEPTAAVRHMCMNRSKVGKYFEALEGLLNRTGLVDRPSQVWNMDETGVQLEHKPRRVLARKGIKYLHARTSSNRETLTVIACVSAAGGSIPPHIIAKGKTSKSLHGFDLQTAPEGSTWSVSPSGWTKQGIAKLWFQKFFLPNIGKERPQISIVDGHDSHNFVELISIAMENQTIGQLHHQSATATGCTTQLHDTSGISLPERNQVNQFCAPFLTIFLFLFLSSSYQKIPESVAEHHSLLISISFKSKLCLLQY